MHLCTFGKSAPAAAFRCRSGLSSKHEPEGGWTTAKGRLLAGRTHNRYNPICFLLFLRCLRSCVVYFGRLPDFETLTIGPFIILHQHHASQFFSAFHSAFFVPYQLGMCSSNSSMIYHTQCNLIPHPEDAHSAVMWSREEMIVDGQLAIESGSSGPVDRMNIWTLLDSNRRVPSKEWNATQMSPPIGQPKKRVIDLGLTIFSSCFCMLLWVQYGFTTRKTPVGCVVNSGQCHFRFFDGWWALNLNGTLQGPEKHCKTEPTSAMKRLRNYPKLGICHASSTRGQIHLNLNSIMTDCDYIIYITIVTILYVYMYNCNIDSNI